jgi:hypothetical protein
MSRRASQPLRQFSEEEAKELQRVSRGEKPERGCAPGWLEKSRSGDAADQALQYDGAAGSGRFAQIGSASHVWAAERARILQEARRTPDRKEDATATWSLTLLQRALRQASDGFPNVSTFTILHTLHEAGYTWQKDRTWCHTGRTLKKGKDGTVYQSEDPYTQEKKR